MSGVNAVPAGWRDAIRSPRLDAWGVARLVAALTSFLPFVGGVATGGAFYFRDLNTYFFPTRRFVVEGLLAGDIRRWNPFVNEGVPVLMPFAYPVDLLQVLAPNEWGFSLLLALHVPLAALTFLGLSRRLGLAPLPATLAALVYALSGFSLSCINLYLHAQAFAWAPLAISLLLEAASGGAREIAFAGVALALCLSTTGVEFTAQALACAFVLAASPRLREHLRFAASVLLGVGLAAAPLAELASHFAGSPRQAGFSTAEALAQSAHPLSLLQALIAGLFGDPIASGYSYWGARFWGGPSPYFVSLYLGGAVLCLAAIGARRASRFRPRILLMLAVGLFVTLGKWSGLDLLLDLAPGMGKFRFPVKAFFTVVVAVSLLAGAGAQRLLESRRAFRALAAAATLVAGGLMSFWLLERTAPGFHQWLQSRLFLTIYPSALRAAALRAVANDAAAGAATLAAVAVVCFIAWRHRVSASLAVTAATGLIAADLLRAGAGLNPTLPASFYRPSSEVQAVAARLRAAGGRAFTCAVLAMPNFRKVVQELPSSSAWSAGVWRESLAPFTNTDLGVETTGVDPTALVAAERSLSNRDSMCNEESTLGRLRANGVRFILSVQPFTNETLRLVDIASPSRIAPLSLYVYELPDSLAELSLWTTPDDVDGEGRGHTLPGATARYVDKDADRLRIVVDAPQQAYLILRRSHAAGWSATVNGEPAAILMANQRHQAVRVPAGRSEVRLRYEPPDGLWGAAGTTLSAAVAVGLLGRARRRLNNGAAASS
jgi:hypothetical protein